MTLLKQRISSIKPASSSSVFSEEGASESARCYVNMNGAGVRPQSNDSLKYDGAERMTKLRVGESQNAEVVCGPVELSKYVDLSGIQGIIPMTSVKLLKSKSKSFLLHLRMKSPRDKSSEKVASQVMCICVSLKHFISCSLIAPHLTLTFCDICHASCMHFYNELS